ncbi:hypothetical protein NDU88_007182 [Pleurodeles waltl]|uniref:Uncharacterized protein n=1 Tax=Pleurodeles waltl TaxID=8319 RepID=A0AAV7QM82_PLEWA|nr:hypothetical protein NDU88_007182 [Pleurodeles waltl]
MHHITYTSQLRSQPCYYVCGRCGQRGKAGALVGALVGSEWKTQRTRGCGGLQDRRSFQSSAVARPEDRRTGELEVGCSRGERICGFAAGTQQGRVLEGEGDLLSCGVPHARHPTIRPLAPVCPPAVRLTKLRT